VFVKSAALNTRTQREHKDAQNMAHKMVTLVKKDLDEAESLRFAEEKLFVADLMELGRGALQSYADHCRDIPFVAAAVTEYLLFCGLTAGMNNNFSKADILLFVDGMYDNIEHSRKKMKEGGLEAVLKDIIEGKEVGKPLAN